MPNTIAAQVSVVRAFFHSGGLKAGTPSLIASTPVEATAPWLNARRIRKRPSAWPPCSTGAQPGGGTNARDLAERHAGDAVPDDARA